MSNPLATIALDEFTRRRGALRRAVLAGQYSAGEANHKAQLWLAVAFACGARTDETVGFASASDIADPDEYLGELARARDVAAQRSIANPADRASSMRSFGLASLALHLGAPGPSIVNQIEKEAA